MSISGKWQREKVRVFGGPKKVVQFDSIQIDGRWVGGIPLELIKDIIERGDLLKTD